MSDSGDEVDHHVLELEALRIDSLESEDYGLVIEEDNKTPPLVEDQQETDISSESTPTNSNSIMSQQILV